MSELKDVFENKRERNDFYIAIVVILLFLFFITRYLGCSQEELLPNVIQENIEVKATSPIDSDLDGIFDDEDKCPNLKGIASNNGCPLDTDGDGIYDKDDHCPNFKGNASNNGCPIDSDGDGVHDGLDKCPKVMGPSENKGCPFDRDGDGIEDALDRCPDKAGVPENGGCPKVVMAAQDIAILENAMKSVEFKTGSADLKPSSSAVLDQIANLMVKYPKYKLSIEGHTDNTSDAGSNLTLSKSRAQTCFNYLVEKQVKAYRMNHNGFGEAIPIADNETKEGRQKNRRVEFKLNY